MSVTISGSEETLNVTMLAGGWIQPRIEQMIFDESIDEDERAYLREKAMVERMTARRLFVDDEY